MVRPYQPGGHTPKRSESEKKQYQKASGRDKEKLNREHRKREQADCQQDGCNNDATEFESQGILGWCLNHFGGKKDD